MSFSTALLNFNPTDMNELSGWSDDLHLTLISILNAAIDSDLQAAFDLAEIEGLSLELNNLDEDGLDSLKKGLLEDGLIEIAGYLQKALFKAELFEVYRLVDGRDDEEMQFWIAVVPPDMKQAPLFSALQADLAQINAMSGSEAIEAEDIFSFNQLESLDILEELMRDQEIVMEPEVIRQAGVRKLNRGGRKSLFPAFTELAKKKSMDDMYEMLMAHAKAQVAQYTELADRPGFTKPIFNAMLVGERGIGKSSIIASIFKSLGLRYVIFNAATMDPYLDLVGLPFIEQVGPQKVSQTAWPVHLAGGIDAIFIDELNRASQPVQNAMMQIILEGKVNDKPIPGLKLVWSAINPPQSRSKNYRVQSLDWALEGRFTMYNLPFDVSEKYLTGREDLVEAFGQPTLMQVIEWWRRFQENSEIDPNEKTFIDPRTLDNILTKAAAAKRRGEHQLLWALAKSLTAYPNVMDGLGAIIGEKYSTFDIMVDVMGALNENPDDDALVAELLNIIQSDPESTKEAFNQIVRYLNTSIIESIENIDANQLMQSNEFTPEEIKGVVEKFFVGPKNAFFHMWINPNNKETFQNMVNIYYGMLSQGAISKEERGPQLLAPIRNIFRMEALVINAGTTYFQNSGLTKDEIATLIITKVLDVSIFGQDFDIAELQDIQKLKEAAKTTDLMDMFANPVNMLKRRLFLAMIMAYLEDVPLRAFTPGVPAPLPAVVRAQPSQE